MVRFGIVLMVICFCASLLLAFIYQLTQPVIESQRSQEELALLKEVLPSASKFKGVMRHDEVYFEGTDKGKIIGFVIRAASKGYAGDIKMLVGIDTDGKMKGVRILEHAETPGLGARITEIKSGEKHPWFLEQFKDKRIQDLGFGNIDTITGATISSRAVFDGIKKESERFLRSKDEAVN
jgi:electron transport complex protein RnfG